MSDELDLAVRARRIITPAGEISGVIGVRGETIVTIEPYDAVSAAVHTIELADDEVLMPGIVDSHVHVNEPGRTEWEGFASATRAAAAGGVTTIIDMPLNSIPPTVDVAALDAKREAAGGQCHIDVGFWGGAVPANNNQLRPLHAAGVFGFKCFLLPSGVDEFPPLGHTELSSAMEELSTFDALMLVHAEDAHTIDQAPEPHGTNYDTFVRSRPSEAENLAITQVIDLERSIGGRVHIVHVSSSAAVRLLAAAKREGLRVTAETCPHYLTFSAEDIPEGATQYKCCPPIRGAADREQLWQGLADGAIDMIVSDHSPSTVDLKNLDTGDFGTAWGGISSLQIGLSVVWTEARRRGHTLGDVARWMCAGPARQTGLNRKGRIAVGNDADFVVFAPDESFVVDVPGLHHKNAVSPYAERPLIGVVRSTWLRGQRVNIQGEPRGRLLTRGEP